jgi:hypothetical protein
MHSQHQLRAGVRLLLAHHVAKRLGVSARTVRWWAETHRLRGFRLRVKIWAFDVRDVEAFAAARLARKAA